MKTWAIRILCLATLAAMGFLATGCHTVAGMGQDISGAGNAMQNAAE